MKANASERCTTANAKAPSLLAGLAYDETGDRLCPTHANKKGRLYRYYISKRLMHQSESSEAGWRLPEEALDRAVVQTIRNFLKDELRLIDALDLTSNSPGRLRTILRRAAALAGDLDDSPTDAQRRLLHQLLHRVTLHPDSIQIALARFGIETAILGKTPESAAQSQELINLTNPVVMKRRGVEAKLIVGHAQGEAAMPSRDLIALLVRAHRWFGQLARGKVRSAREIARLEEYDPGEVSRTMQLAFLAPDIVEAILSGRQPVELTPRCLMRIGEIPLEWRSQRRLLGFQV